VHFSVVMHMLQITDSFFTIFSNATQSLTTKVFTDSGVGRVVTVDIVLIPYSSWWTLKLATCCKHCHVVPVSTLDVLGRVIVWKVVSIHHYVVVDTWIGQTAAKLSNYNTQHGHSHRISLLQSTDSKFAIFCEIKCVYHHHHCHRHLHKHVRKYIQFDGLVTAVL